MQIDYRDRAVYSLAQGYQQRLLVVFNPRNPPPLVVVPFLKNRFTGYPPNYP
jgi:hypothetical protein